MVQVEHPRRPRVLKRRADVVLSVVLQVLYRVRRLRFDAHDYLGSLAWRLVLIQPQIGDEVGPGAPIHFQITDCRGRVTNLVEVQFLVIWLLVSRAVLIFVCSISRLIMLHAEHLL